MMNSNNNSVPMKGAGFSHMMERNKGTLISYEQGTKKDYVELFEAYTEQLELEANSQIKNIETIREKILSADGSYYYRTQNAIAVEIGKAICQGYSAQAVCNLVNIAIRSRKNGIKPQQIATYIKNGRTTGKW